MLAIAAAHVRFTHQDILLGHRAAAVAVALVALYLLVKVARWFKRKRAARPRQRTYTY